MEPAGVFSSHLELHPPTLTRFKAYMPKEGVKIDISDVISFYENFYSQRGWKPAAWRKPECPHLHMEIMRSTMHSADFQLWISPDGELLTIYMDERRVLFPLPAKFTRYETLFETVAEQNDFYTQKAYEFGWEEYYENEYLETCERYGFYRNSRKSDPPLSGCCNSSGRFSAVLLLYENEAVAKEQKEKWDLEASKYKHIERIDNGDGTGSIRMRSWRNQIVIQDGNILIKIDNMDEDQTNLVSKVASEIENYSNQNIDPTRKTPVESGND